MRVELNPPRLSAAPGRPSVIVVEVTNTGSVISGHRLRVLGLDPAWVRVDRDELSLFPDASGAFTVTVQLPARLPAGTRTLEIEVQELTPPNEVSRSRLEITVPAEPNVSVAIDPVSSVGGATAVVGVLVQNTGNSVLDVPLAGKDDEGQVSFAFAPESVHLSPGEQTRGSVTLSARRPWFGNQKIRGYVIEAGSARAPVIAHGAWAQRPRLTRGNLALAGLVIAATVFAIVLSTTLSDVVSQSNADRDLALQVAAANQSHPVGGTSEIGGTVTLLSSGSPSAGVTVDLYSAASPASPIVSTATGATGGYHFSGLAAGNYKLSFTGAGFIQLWYPEALSAAQAGVVSVGSGAHRLGVDIRLGGAPASVSGQVTGQSVTGAVLTLSVSTAASPATGSAGATTASPGSASAIVTSVTLGATGDFTLANVPAPAVYDLVVTEAGYATALQEIDLVGGENRTGVTIALHQGNGSISGTVTSPTGLIGGATISASSETTTADTVSATTHGDVGSFVLANLPTPSTVILVVSANGYASQTVSVSLATAQQVSGISVTLLPGIGAISGTVTTPANTALGGVSVTATNGSLSFQTTTLSTDKVGSYSLSNLPVPGAYTVTFSRSDLAGQTQQVSLQATGKTSAKIDVAMTSRAADISGIVKDESGAGVGEVSVSLVSGATTYTVTTASKPTAGAYEVDGVTPGTYDLSFSRQGGVPTSVIVTLSAGQTLTQNETLTPSASIVGYVVSAADPSQPVPDAEVNLYLSSQYPTVIAATTQTAANGEFVFNNVQAPQSYVVAVAYPAGSSAQETVTLTTGLGLTTPACGSSATGSTSTTTSTSPASSSCNPATDPIEVTL